MIRRNFLKIIGLFGLNSISSKSIANEKLETNLIELTECYVVGLQYYDGKNYYASKDKFLTLKREPNNIYDKKAIEVFDNNLKIGYVPKRENRVIAKIMDQKVDVVAKVIKFNKDEAYYNRIKVKIYQIVG
ncbi:hypothetical protein MNB_SV-15-229 [hydrothermal vent metagenome]|uniref:HIRAN domain-containing protein n=1 Tax=hydrothermal vent metagenome TaxID=652676 RepID=A0A1W1EJV3_9ZZZZ